MKVSSIIFNDDMVKATLEGRMKVIRRAVKPQPIYSPNTGFSWGNKYCTGQPSWPPTVEGAAHNFLIHAPYKVGDILWVKETWHKYTKRIGEGEACRISEFFGYKASVANSEDAEEQWKPSVHMPKEAARIFLKITKIKMERLQDMTEEDVFCAGIHYCDCPYGYTWKTHSDMNNCYTEPKGAMRAFWNSSIKKEELFVYGWNSNPYVWVIEYELCERPDNFLSL